MPSPPTHHLVLAGGGHSHALLLKAWAMRGAPAAAIVTLVSRASTLLYSGMVPGLIAGLYGRQECCIDLRRLCELAGVTFVRAEITGLDLVTRDLQLAGRPPIRWDRLSLDVGAVTTPADAAGFAFDLPIKPLEPFLDWCQAQTAAAESGDLGPLVVRGGGAAGVEVALALRARLGHRRRVMLALAAEGLRLGSPAANRCGQRLLAAAGIPMWPASHLGADSAPDAGAGALSIRCTGSRAPAWLAAAGLPADPATGRVLTTATLQVEGHPAIFASGDCGQIRAEPRPPSGVWAVRAAPVLAENLGRSLGPDGPRLRRWRPQQRALQLLGDATKGSPPRAVAVWGPLALGPSPWLWRWKTAIDCRFMAGFTSLAPMGSGLQPAAAMPCRGCAAKLPADPLVRALARLAALGGGSFPARGAEDAQVLGTTVTGASLLQSLDGFPALVADPWLNGRLTTLHACSDLWACGGRVTGAQALVTLPRADERLQEELLLQTLAGVRSVLEPLGAELLGGHTLEQLEAGEGLSLALTVNGEAPPGRFWSKGGLRPGDALLLTRPIGTGVLFAAAMAGAARPAWIDAALERMQQSQAPLVEPLAAHGCHACTDITGFGLLGHLAEMLEAAPGLQVALQPAAIPALTGVWELLTQGFASSLAPANRRALGLIQAGAVRIAAPGSRHPQPQPPKDLLQELLIDPQTCGPLLAAVPAERAESALAAARTCGFTHASLIGRVIASGHGQDNGTAAGAGGVPASVRP
ncbi:selenide, water dikinase SelD [Synechococcus sp. Tobar12-5m-g]|uniref:selenide, water dikinase SelD n=1 Tax=unclassified Synechococcus TaxID=2626047 RepID=UPI0020CDEFAC|nr:MULTISPECIES: selenide, water dikinase SelD [unclassified Synechococcus]MCP9771888.1 selenide, water dikinase SelD [Synechococcus sp. Tobar12-5m-g]MCP9872830.1 selenide, water dikinase SelD [Synechococcus sp. Cruz CV-v-12]